MLENIKSISDKYVQQTLADNCAKRSTLKPTKHKFWSVR
ncbi:MAG: entry exclusion lipoprotein TrbK [Methylococcaceae bacterium]|nr:entry exclusion lipoprotein TrbK [Methylococcaceae bacterium]